MILGIAKPVKEVGDELRDLPGGRCDVYDLFSRKDANSASAEVSSPILHSLRLSIKYGKRMHLLTYSNMPEVEKYVKRVKLQSKMTYEDGKSNL